MNNTRLLLARNEAIDIIDIAQMEHQRSEDVRKAIIHVRILAQSIERKLEHILEDTTSKPRRVPLLEAYGIACAFKMLNASERQSQEDLREELKAGMETAQILKQKLDALLPASHS